MTPEERSQLDEMLKSAPGPATRLGVAVANAVLLWLLGLAVLVIAWSVLAWGAREISGGDLGLHSPIAPWIACFGALASLIPAITSSLRWFRTWRDPKALIRADIEAGAVEEEMLTFTSGKRFQEPEDGGLMYFLRTKNGRAFVVFDHESQNLGVAGKDPLSTSFRPCVDLLITRAPGTRFVLTTSFSGQPLDIGSPTELQAPPEDWPEQDEFCDIPWEELENRLGHGA